MTSFASRPRWRAVLLAAGLVCALVPRAHGQVVDEVLPDQGTLGSVVTLAGSGFGETRGRVTLVDPAKKKDPRQAILSWSDTLIELRVRRAPLAGPASFEVQPKDGGLATAAFTVVPPVIGAFDKTIATPKERVTIMVHDLGNRRPRIDVGWKRVPVVKRKLVDGAPDDREVTFRIPRRALADGVWDVRVTNAVGDDLLQTKLQIQGSKRKRIARRQVVGTVRGVEFKAKASGMKTVVVDELGVTTAEGATADGPGTLGLTFGQPALIPTVFSGPPDDAARVTYTELVDGKQTVWTSDGGPVSITVQGRVKNQFGGIFAATLSADGQPDVAVAGAFVNRIP